MRKEKLYKRLLSYIYPVSIRKDSSTENPVLELFLYRNQYQLATIDSLYSDGDRYSPLKLGVKKLKGKLEKVSNVLVLGSGLGSACLILHKAGYRPDYTLVDIDETVLTWAIEHLPVEIANRVDPICKDAKNYIDSVTSTFDLIIVDVFKDRVVPQFAENERFISRVHKRLNPGGYLIMNYIVNNENDWKGLKDNFIKIFPTHEVHELGINKVIISKA